MRSFYFVVKMEYFLPLSPNVCLAVLFGYYPAQPFVAERGKSTILTTKRCCENGYLLPLTRKIVLAVLFWYYPAPIFLAERGKSTILTTKRCYKNS